VVEPTSGRTLVEHRVSQVTMRQYTDAELEAFVASGEAMDKAGAYAIQDPVFRPASSVEGCYANVMGLPLCTAMRMLGELGTVVRPAPGWRPPGPCPECEALASAQGEAP
jgi:predicted house-cleaning NTP pyrophosphatase (Maf/HAM1 superfamily)